MRNVSMRSSIVYNPTNWNTITALLNMRTKRVLRDVHKLYVMILLPVVFLATGIILNKLSHEAEPLRSILLNNSRSYWLLVFEQFTIKILSIVHNIYIYT